MTAADGQPRATRAPEADTADSVLAGPSTWTLDPARSSVALRSKTMWGLVTVRGWFGELAGNAEILPGGAARGRLEIGAASLDTKNAKRDRHLASADFFNAAEHPSIVADLASATRTGDRVAVQRHAHGRGVDPAAQLHRHAGGRQPGGVHAAGRRGRGGPGRVRPDLEPDGHADRPVDRRAWWRASRDPESRVSTVRGSRRARG